MESDRMLAHKTGREKWQYRDKNIDRDVSCMFKVLHEGYWEWMLAEE